MTREKMWEEFETGIIDVVERWKKRLEQEPCEDWYDVPSNEMTLEQARQAVKDLRKKLVEHLEQEQKTGHWEQYGNYWEDKFKCSECGKEQPKILCGERIIGHWSDYCPKCGARMIEPQESEE
jgi:DNA-directed RNA polymerase subunit RPC12/RpoP